MDKNIINFVIQATTTGVDAAGKVVEKLTHRITGTATAAKVATGWFGKLRFAISSFMGGIGILAQIISGVAAAWQLFKEKADQAAEAAKEAAKKTREAWKNATDAV